MSAPIGFVGVGRMGGSMALRALESGVDIVAFDVAPAACRE